MTNKRVHCYDNKTAQSCTLLVKQYLAPVSYTHLDVYKRQVGETNAEENENTFFSLEQLRQK